MHEIADLITADSMGIHGHLDADVDPISPPTGELAGLIPVQRVYVIEETPPTA